MERFNQIGDKVKAQLSHTAEGLSAESRRNYGAFLLTSALFVFAVSDSLDGNKERALVFATLGSILITAVLIDAYLIGRNKASANRESKNE